MIDEAHIQRLEDAKEANRKAVRLIKEGVSFEVRGRLALTDDEGLPEAQLDITFQEGHKWPLLIAATENSMGDGSCILAWERKLSGDKWNKGEIYHQLFTVESSCYVPSPSVSQKIVQEVLERLVRKLGESEFTLHPLELVQWGGMFDEEVEYYPEILDTIRQAEAALLDRGEAAQDMEVLQAAIEQEVEEAAEFVSEIHVAACTLVKGEEVRAYLAEVEGPYPDSAKRQAEERHPGWECVACDLKIKNESNMWGEVTHLITDFVSGERKDLTRLSGTQ